MLALAFAPQRRYMPVAEAVGVVAFLVLGLRWSFGVLGDVYGD